MPQNITAGHGQISHEVPSATGVVVEIRDGNHRGTSVWRQSDGWFCFVSHDSPRVEYAERCVLVAGQDVEELGRVAFGCDLSAPRGLFLVGLPAEDDLAWLTSGAEVLWDSAHYEAVVVQKLAASLSTEQIVLLGELLGRATSPDQIALLGELIHRATSGPGISAAIDEESPAAWLAREVGDLPHAADVWRDLEEALRGKNGFGGHVAEIYAFRLLPTLTRRGELADRPDASPEGQAAAANLWKILRRFQEVRPGCEILVNGGEGPPAPFTWRVQVRVSAPTAPCGALDEEASHA